MTILAALPLSLGGTFIGQLLADKSFSMRSLINLIMLMGLATKNSMLLVEYAADSSFRSPMAVAVIGGLITSTFLSLLVIPAVFTYVDDLEQGFKRLLDRLRRHKTPASGAEPDLRMETDVRPV